MLERDSELSVLADAVQAAAAGRGSVVLVFGEAGIGKSSLVEVVRARLPAEGRMFAGYCDDLATPRTLGPFRDLVGSVGAELSRAITDGHDRDRLLSALRAELDWPEHPAVLVIEDVHWADDATLDALRYLIRRIGSLPAVLVLTYRDDELSHEHALTGLLAQAARSEDVRRLPLRRLTADAVRQLSADSAVNLADLFALTSGNPFFVTELLASAGLLAEAEGEPVPHRSPMRCKPGSGGWTVRSRTCWSSSPWSPPPWTAGWWTRYQKAWWRTSWRPCPTPNAVACSRSRCAASRSGTSSPAGRSRDRCPPPG
jgi:hypothetical protein